MNPRRVLEWLRSRPEIIAFAIGLVLFGGGALKLILDQSRASQSFGSGSSPSPAAPDPRTRMGPAPGEQLAPYLDRKRKLLGERASKEPKTASFAAVSFDGYRKPEEAEVFVASNKLELSAALVRLPLPGFGAAEVKASNRLTKTLEEELKLLKDGLQRELDELEAIIPTVTDQAFRKVYEEDAARHRGAIDLIDSEPAVVFGVVVRGPLATLARVATTPGVRLVDLPDDPAASVVTHRFVGILPEETERALPEGQVP